MAVVTGAASGLGREFVLLLAERGWRCIAADVDEAGLAGTRGRAASGSTVRTVRTVRTDELEALGSAVKVSVAFPGAIDTGIAHALLARPKAERMPIDELLADLVARGEPAGVVARAILDAVDTGAFALFPQPRVAEQALAPHRAAVAAASSPGLRFRASGA